jgi:hypothetical protein
MSRDRSLDEFFSASDDEGTASTPEAEAEPEDDADEETESTPEVDTEGADEEETEAATTADDEEPEEREAADGEGAEAAEAAGVDVDNRPDTDEHDGEPEPPRATYRWSAEGDTCPDCGTVVEQRWRDGDRFVCAGCKEW